MSDPFFGAALIMSGLTFIIRSGTSTNFPRGLGLLLGGGLVTGGCWAIWPESPALAAATRIGTIVFALFLTAWGAWPLMERWYDRHR